MARGKHYSKKRQWQIREPVEEIVDDIAHAATFAILPTQNNIVTTPTVVGGKEGKEEEGLNDKDDDNEIEMDDDDDEESDSSDDDDDASSVGTGEDGDAEPDNDDDDDDDDDESDVDLAAAVAELEQRGEDLESGVTSAPKTENELDAYQTPIQELERHLKFQLTVEENDGEMKFRKLNSENLSLAGQVKHFMAMDRTVVVESSPPPNDNKNKGFEDVIPLDEGSLLLMRGPANDHDNGTNPPSMIPLGRVFEVFGPISRPLYTIRLSSPPPTQKSKTKTPKKALKTNKKESKKGEETASNDAIDTGGGGGGGIDASSEKKVDSVPTVEETPKNDNMDASKLQEATKLENDDTQIEESQESGSEKVPAPTSQNNATKEEDVTSNVTVDPWSINGEYGKILSGSDPVSVYFVKDEATLVDTSAVMRNSGKGCDASNVYDEEITNTNEMYFSDDEKEREAKGRRKKGRSQHPQNQQHYDNQHHHSSVHGANGNRGIPQGFHQPSGPPQGFHRPPPPPPPRPQGFHRPPASTQQQQQLPQGFHAQQQRHPGSGMSPPPPPPPPPPPAPQQQNQNQFYYQY